MRVPKYSYKPLPGVMATIFRMMNKHFKGLGLQESTISGSNRGAVVGDKPYFLPWPPYL